MTTEEQAQAAELIDTLADLETRYPAITPALRDELQALVEKLQTMYSSDVARTSMRVIGQTHVTLRQHQQETDNRVAGVVEDMAGMHETQDAATALILLNTKAIAAIVAEHVQEALDERLTQLEAMFRQRSRVVGEK